MKTNDYMKTNDIRRKYSSTTTSLSWFATTVGYPIVFLFYIGAHFLLPPKKELGILFALPIRCHLFTMLSLYEDSLWFRCAHTVTSLTFLASYMWGINKFFFASFLSQIVYCNIVQYLIPSPVKRAVDCYNTEFICFCITGTLLGLRLAPPVCLVGNQLLTNFFLYGGSKLIEQWNGNGFNTLNSE